MNKSSRSAYFTVLAFEVSLLAAGGAILPGCSKSGVDMAVHQAAKDRSDIDRTIISQGTLSIPADTRFNYSRFRSGQEGNVAKGESIFLITNGARCGAQVSGHGTAWGTFQLGYTFDNTTDQRLNAVVKVHLTIHESISSADKAAAIGDFAQASGNILFFIKDTNGLLSAKENLLSIKRDSGPTSSTAQKDLILNATFEPRRGYYLVISGRTDVAAEPGQSAAARLEVTDVSMKIQWHGADVATQAPTDRPDPNQVGSTDLHSDGNKIP